MKYGHNHLYNVKTAEYDDEKKLLRNSSAMPTTKRNTRISILEIPEMNK